MNRHLRSTLQDKIDRLTQRLDDTEMLLETCPRDDISYIAQLRMDYGYLLNFRGRLLQERDNG